jgi:hypothetical protein
MKIFQSASNAPCQGKNSTDLIKLPTALHSDSNNFRFFLALVLHLFYAARTVYKNRQATGLERNSFAGILETEALFTSCICM